MGVSAYCSEPMLLFLFLGLPAHYSSLATTSAWRATIRNEKLKGEGMVLWVHLPRATAALAVMVASAEASEPRTA
jgi:hypothetical protein